MTLCPGWCFFAQGAQKLLGWFGGYGFEHDECLYSAGMPVPLALLVMLIEFLGRLSLPVGLLSRLAGLGITVVMVGRDPNDVCHQLFVDGLV